VKWLVFLCSNQTELEKVVEVNGCRVDGVNEAGALQRAAITQAWGINQAFGAPTEWVLAALVGETQWSEEVSIVGAGHSQWIGENWLSPK